MLNEHGRIVSTREPNPTPTPGPRFALVRDTSGCSWATRVDVADTVTAEINSIASREPPVPDLRSEPVYANEYISLVGGRVHFGPAFTFPETIARPDDVVLVENISQLERHFRGWSADELPERAPIMAIMEGADAISVCFCARRSRRAAEAGVETARECRGQGLASRVTAAWALSIRASGHIPIYSTSWANSASLAVARRLDLNACASDWSLSD